MSKYLRLYVPGGTYFFTLVTAQRAPIFQNSENIQLLREAISEVKNKRPFQIIAAVILPDHLHMMWTLPVGDTDYSSRLANIKSSFTRSYLARGGREQSITTSQKHQQRRGVWQPRFMEHTCRDADDFRKHVDYIHYNPVKHGLTKCPADWPHSSIHKFITTRQLPKDWGSPGVFHTEPGSEINDQFME